MGAISLEAGAVPGIRELGLESALGVVLTDKETQLPSGALLVGDALPRKWRPNDSFFLQAVGDQLVLAVSHTRLRSLVRTLAVADEKTGLLSRGAYIDCLLSESNRARAHNTPLSLLILEVDNGPEILRQHGDAAAEQYMEELARVLCSSIRQTDVAVKYTGWSLAFLLPDTPVENAQILADKLRNAAAKVQAPWGAPEVTVSMVAAQATSRPSDDTEDRVTEWINRAEFGLEDLRQQGGNVIAALATP
jgi:diguanylate cyclase (GGDEF)-like protein